MGAPPVLMYGPVDRFTVSQGLSGAVGETLGALQPLSHGEDRQLLGYGGFQSRRVWRVRV